MTREEIYNTQINPLMAQILQICQANKIPMLADFDLASEENAALKCTSCLLDPTWKPGPEMLRAFQHLRPRAESPMMVTVDHGNGSKTMAAIL